MSEGWGNQYNGEVEDVDSSDNSTDDDSDNDPDEFQQKLQEAVLNDNLEDIDPSSIRFGLDNVESTNLIKEAYQADTRTENLEMYESVLMARDVDFEKRNPPENSDTDDSLPEFDNSETEAESESVSEVESSNDPEPEPQIEDDAQGNDMEDTDSLEDGDPFQEVLGDEWMNREEAAESGTIYRVLPWGRPETGKTHFSMSMPEPILYIDTENKASDIADKFPNKTIKFITPRNYTEAVQAVEKALDYLRKWLDKRGVRGTIVVDSMTDMWSWSQEEYVNRYYPTSDNPDEVDFNSAMEGGSDDWKVIKRLHNDKFRKKLVDSPFHICLPCRAKEDYSQVFEGKSQAPDMPSGEKENVYVVNHIIHLQNPDGGNRVGHLEKSGLICSQFSGLTQPTFEKMKDVILDIKSNELEAGDTNVDESVTDYDVEVGTSVASRGGE